MKFRSAFVAILTLLVGVSFSHAAPLFIADRPVLWSVHLDVNRARSGVGLELFANLDADLIPMLVSTVEKKSGGLGGTLEALTFYGFQPLKGSHGEVPFLANLTFSPQGESISKRFEAIREKRGLAVEEVAGYPALHFAHQGKEVWVAKIGDYQIVVGTSRDLLELSLAPGAGGLAGLSSSPENATDLLGGTVELQQLHVSDSTLRKSELLKMLSRVEFHFDTNDKQLNLNASAELGDDRSAKRAARIIEGMTAAIAMEDKTGVPWDERLVLKQDGSHLAMRVHLDPQEAKALLDRVSGEIKASYNKPEGSNK